MISKLALVIALLVSLSYLIVPVGAHGSADTITVFRCMSVPLVDGAWGLAEWDDAEQKTMLVSQGSGAAFFRMKTCQNPLDINKWFVYGIIDFVSDPTLTASADERADIQFDTKHDGGTTPQPDDYWFHMDGASTGPGYVARGTGSGWATDTSRWLWGVEYAWGQELGASPNSGSAHHIYEFMIIWNKLTSAAGVSVTEHGLLVVAQQGDDPANILGYPQAGFQQPDQWADASYSMTVIPEFIHPELLAGLVTGLALITILLQQGRRKFRRH